jgi:hypothetical protein
MSRVTIKVDKSGDIDSYLNKPVLDRMTRVLDLSTNSISGNDDSKVIGVISEAVEMENCFELTLTIFDEEKLFPRREFMGKELISFSIS